jgi:hypothetical protein
VKYCKKGETAQEVGKIFEARHYENKSAEAELSAL